MKYILLFALVISVASAQTYHCVPKDPANDPHNCNGDDYFNTQARCEGAFSYGTCEWVEMVTTTSAAVTTTAAPAASCDASWTNDASRCSELLSLYNEAECCNSDGVCGTYKFEYNCRQCCSN